MKKEEQKKVPRKTRGPAARKKPKPLLSARKKPSVGSEKKSSPHTKREVHVPVMLEKNDAGSRHSLAGRIRRAFLRVAGSLLAFALLVFIYVNLPVSASDDAVKMGTTFSARYASDIGLDWRQAYVAMLDELGIRHIRVPVYWDLVEKEEGKYDFADLDWQLEQAREREAKVVLAIGRKVPRWPECFIPAWVGEDTAMQKEKLLRFEESVIARYKDNHPEIAYWQVENEPFLDYGICPAIDKADLLDSEIAVFRKNDASRPIVVTDSGELSLWIQAAKRGDVFGTTMYRTVYTEKYGYWRYPIGPNFFKLKQSIIKLFAQQDNAIVIELQGEPWLQGPTVGFPVEQQLISMNAQILKDNVEFAKKTGMKEVYVWGVEWWYWMKAVKNNPTLWEQAQSIYRGN